jgi:hypothetical protein
VLKTLFLQPEVEERPATTSPTGERGTTSAEQPRADEPKDEDTAPPPVF